MYSLETLSEIEFELSSHCNSKCPQCPRYDTFGRVQKDLNVTHLDLNIINKLPMRKMRKSEARKERRMTRTGMRRKLSQVDKKDYKAEWEVPILISMNERVVWRS